MVVMGAAGGLRRSTRGEAAWALSAGGGTSAATAPVPTGDLPARPHPSPLCIQSSTCISASDAEAAFSWMLACAHADACLLQNVP